MRIKRHSKNNDKVNNNNNNNSKKKIKYDFVQLNPNNNISVIKKIKKTNKSNQQSQKEIKERSICGCQARLHSLVNNCLRCGRIVCEKEGAGNCFYCGYNVSSYGELQIPFNGQEKIDEKIKISEKEKIGLESAQKNLLKLIEFEKNNAERTSVFDDQADYFDMSNKWISEEQRLNLARLEQEVLKSKQNSEISIVLDFTGRQVISESSDESFSRLKSEFDSKLKIEREKELNKKSEASNIHHLEKLKTYDTEICCEGSKILLPNLNVPPPQFVSRIKNNVNKTRNEPKLDKSLMYRVQHEYYPEVNIFNSE